uniref:Uncharacterized protein n=1 Tax=Arundo donax TaxID=35708 RepID=A0A0A9GIB2_ARUDO
MSWSLVKNGSMYLFFE